MPASSPQHTAATDALSALVDGQATAQELDQILAAWGSDAKLRQTWAEHQQVGEVMRSPEGAMGTDANAFLNRFRDRLANEPVVLAPAAARANAPQVSVQPLKRRTWAGPTAVAAGFVMVVGAMVSALAPQTTVPADSLAFGERRINLANSDVGQGLDAAAAVPVATAMASAQALAPIEAPMLVGQAAGATPSFSQPARFRHLLITDARLDQALSIRRSAPMSQHDSFASRHAGVYTVSLSAP